MKEELRIKKWGAKAARVFGLVLLTSALVYGSGGIGGSGGGSTAAAPATPVYAAITRTSVQTISTGSPTKVDLSTVYVDSTGSSMGDSANKRINITQTGNYLVSFYVAGYSFSDTKSLSGDVVLNGDSAHPVMEKFSNTSTTAAIGVSRSEILSLTAGDYLELWVTQDTGGSVDILTTVMWIRPTLSALKL